VPVPSRGDLAKCREAKAAEEGENFHNSNVKEIAPWSSG
jgi:hypothetical protein